MTSFLSPTAHIVLSGEQPEFFLYRELKSEVKFFRLRNEIDTLHKIGLTCLYCCV